MGGRKPSDPGLCGKEEVQWAVKLFYYTGTWLIAVLEPDSKQASPHKNVCSDSWPSLNKTVVVHQHLPKFTITHYQSFFFVFARQEIASNQPIDATPQRYMQYPLMCVNSPGTSFLGLTLGESRVQWLKENVRGQNSSDTGHKWLRA